MKADLVWRRQEDTRTDAKVVWERPSWLEVRQRYNTWMDRVNPYSPSQRPGELNPYDVEPFDINPFRNPEPWPPSAKKFPSGPPPRRVNPIPGADLPPDGVPFPIPAPRNPEVQPSPIGTGKRRFTDDD